MKDFNSYYGGKKDEPKKEDKSQKNGTNYQGFSSDAFEKAQQIASSLNGKSEGDIFKAVLAEAERSRKAGTLSDADLDNFYNTMSAMLDENKKAKLKSVIEKLKKM